MRQIAYLIILLSIHFSATAQTTWYVPDDFATIQGAITDASVKKGDTVIVRPGTYTENINFMRKAILLISEQGPDVTILDGGNPANPDLGSVVSFTEGEDADSILDGFTLTNGTGTCVETSPGSYEHIGGGVFCDDYTSPTLRNNRITLNSVSINSGGGIFCDFNSFPTIINNTITQNVAVAGSGIYCAPISSPNIMNNVIAANDAWFGGGIYCHYCSPDVMNNKITANTAFTGGGIECNFNASPTIVGNFIADNTNSPSAGSGGGINCLNESSPIIRGNTIVNNFSVYGGGITCNFYSAPQIVNNTIRGNEAGNGAGILCDSYSSPTIINNQISENIGDIGGGIQCSYYSSPSITNNTVTGNSGFCGGGISCRNASSPNIYNTILWGNTATIGPQLSLEGTTHHCIVTIDASDVEGGQSAVFVETGCTLHWGSSMIELDPLFIDPTMGDIHIPYTSPCRDAGDNAVITELYDLEGDPRIAHGTVDIGADEFHPHLYYTGDAAPSGSVQAKFVGLPGTLINGAILGVNIFDPPLPCDYGLWYMDNPFQIITGLGAIPPTGIAIFSGTIPAVPPAPYTLYLQGVIDMELTNLCPMAIE